MMHGFYMEMSPGEREAFVILSEAAFEQMSSLTARARTAETERLFSRIFGDCHRTPLEPPTLPPQVLAERTILSYFQNGDAVRVGQQAPETRLALCVVMTLDEGLGDDPGAAVTGQQKPYLGKVPGGVQAFVVGTKAFEDFLHGLQNGSDALPCCGVQAEGHEIDGHGNVSRVGVSNAADLEERAGGDQPHPACCSLSFPPSL